MLKEPGPGEGEVAGTDGRQIPVAVLPIAVGVSFSENSQSRRTL